MKSSEVGFRESQRFSQVWIWFIIAVIDGLCWWAFVQQIILGRPFGDHPASDGVMVVICVLAGIGLPLLLVTCRLVTEVRADGLYIRFVPLHLTWRRFGFDDIASCEARTYRPLLEYGGWGIRWGPSGRAYNVSGNRGVQLVLSNGKRLLIGSQKAEELATAIRQGMSPVARRHG